MAAPGNPLVSIVIPVFNGANFLAEAIDSALAQSYPHCEIVVVNDGSDDDGRTAAVCRGYGDAIRYAEKPNGGVASALNHAIGMMRGDWFSWLSHDDLYHPLKVELQVAAAQRWRDRDIVVCSDFEVLREGARRVPQVRLDEAIRHVEPDGVAWPALLGGYINGCSLLIPRHALARHGPFDEALRYTQDYDYWMRLATSCFFLLMPLSLVRYRVHDTQASRTAFLTDEHEALWPRLVAAVPPQRHITISGSSLRFFDDRARFLREHAVAPRAADWCEAQRDASLERAGLTVILHDDGGSHGVAERCRSIAARSPSPLEIIVVRSERTTLAEPLPAPPDGCALRVASIDDDALAGATLGAIAGTAAHEYVVVIVAGQAQACPDLATQRNHMVREAWVGSRADGDALGPVTVAAGPSAWAALAEPGTMLHRTMMAPHVPVPPAPEAEPVSPPLAALARDCVQRACGMSDVSAASLRESLAALAGDGTGGMQQR